MAEATYVKTPYSRLFVIEDRAGPANSPDYKGQARPLGPSYSFGDRTPVRQPSDRRYGGFDTVDAIKGERGLPTISVENRYQYTLDEFLALAKKGCAFDLQIHFGQCQDPKAFNDFNKILVLEGTDISKWAASEMGAFEQGKEAVIMDTIDTNSLEMYEVLRLVFQEIAGTEIVQEVVKVVICDSVSCGLCGIPSNGCQTFFAITKSHGGSPGLAAEVIYSSDGGATIGQTNIGSLLATEDPSGAACVGTRLVVVSNEADALFYTTIADLVNGAATWVKNVTGIVASGSPNRIFSLGTSFTWIVSDAGYIYFSEDITDRVTVQEAGVATVQNLLGIHGIGFNDLIAVGASNVVLKTNNGGQTWSLITGPAVGVSLTCCWMISKTEWLVGTANGKLYYTRNSGVSWTEKTFPGSGAANTSVDDIQFATRTVGAIAVNVSGVSAVGKILRTISGGNSWYVLPEGGGAIPTNDKVTSLALCADDVNRVYAGGLGANAVDGILLRGA